ncbi:hypothetical protein [Microbulbifer hainanensis]|uniref:hypothetical protein n=1 Tax=Microbulbifer hainanensis TaxID=2735675 RepID=UPI0018671635|nr:hypothetical protein [Microbulbifer hainanensis]
MTLHLQATKQTFANRMRNVWKDWNRTGGSRTTRRRQSIEQAIRGMTTFMPTPAISHNNLGPGLCGSFSWGSWRLRLNANYTNDAHLIYEDFVELCATIYHETRHSEQFFRISQGLAGGELEFPDQNSSSKINAHTNVHGMGSVQDRIRMFQQVSQGTDVSATPQMISRWLSVPLNVSNQASQNARNDFRTFCGTARPTWFKRSSIKLEVEEWMRECYKTTLSGVGNFAQSDHSPWNFYANQPTERDAHGIEDDVTALIEAAIGVRVAQYGNRSRSSSKFNHLV